MSDLKIDGKTAEEKADDLVTMVEEEIKRLGPLSPSDIAEMIQAELYIAIKDPYCYNEEFESDVLEVLSQRNNKLKTN